jgi:hypothetical protein
MSDGTWDLALVREVHRALRCYRNELKLAQSPLLELLAGHRAASGPLKRAIALRRLLCAALERLSLEDEMLGQLLRSRFVQGVPIHQLEQQGWARSTLFRYQRMGIVSLARILIEGKVRDGQRIRGTD